MSLSLGQEDGRQTQVLGLESLQSAKKVAYPVFIDPDWSVSRNAYLYVDSAFPNTSYWNGQYTDSTVHVGFLPASWDYTYGLNHVARGFYQFDTRPIVNKVILSARMNVVETWSSSCTPTAVSAWVTGGVGPGTTWNAQPGYLNKVSTQNVAKGNSASCPAGTVGFDMGSSTGWLTNSPQWTVGLRAENEGDPLGWKRFDNNASMVVTYDTAPTTPQIYWISRANWDATPWAAGSRYVTRLSQPTYAVWASDPDGAAGGNLTVTMTVKTRAGAVKFSGTTGPGAPDPYTTYTWTGGTLADGDYTLEAYATDRYGIRSGTMGFNFTVDTTPPKPPVIAAPAAFDADHNDPAGVPGKTEYTFTLSDGGSYGLQGFIYSVEAEGKTTTYDGDAACNTRHGPLVVVCPPNRSSATITIAAIASSTSLTVWAFDTAGNVSQQVRSQPVTFTFAVPDGATPMPTTVAPVATSGGAVWQDIEVDGGTPVANSCTGTVASPDPMLDAGKALELSASGDRAVTSAAAVDASKPFSVSAWVCPKSTTTAQAVLTQLAGPGIPAARLGLESGGAAVLIGWTSTGAPDTVASTRLMPAGAWSFVSAVYDPVNRQMRITVNTTGYTSTWIIATSAASHVASSSAQPVVIGDSGTHGTDQFRGQVYHPLMAPGVLTDQQFAAAQSAFITDMGVLK